MHNPFPGMNPYLEGALWSDVHHELASAIRQLIAPQISPKYITRIETYTVKDTAAEEEIGILYSDVALLLKEKTNQKNLSSKENTLTATPPTLSIPTTQPFLEVNIPVIEIRDQMGQKLITAIEILSPANKRGEGLQKYRSKREELISSQVNFLEIDLLRRGTRPFTHPLVPRSAYMISLVRGGEAKTQIWSIGIRDSLPILPIPLQKEDADVLLYLGEALTLCFERGLYHLSIAYEEMPPPPAIEAEEWEWMKTLKDTE